MPTPELLQGRVWKHQFPGVYLLETCQKLITTAKHKLSKQRGSPHEEGNFCALVSVVGRQLREEFCGEYNHLKFLIFSQSKPFS